MRLAALYTVFNGLELLEGSINQIYDHVDMVIISYQKVSHHGEESLEVEPFVVKLKDKYPKIKLIEFKTRAGAFSKNEERRKINQMISLAGEECSHFFISATDHYYESSRFANSKLIAEKYDVTASKMYTYFKDPRWRLTPLESYYMPFICKITDKTYSKDTKGVWNVPIDPALCIVPNESFYEFKEDELIMHHYSMVRDDIENKLRNAAARVNFNSDIEQIIKDCNNYKGVGKVPYFSRDGKSFDTIIVDNIFKI